MNEELRDTVTIMHEYYKELDNVESGINHIKRLEEINMHSPITCAEEMERLLTQKTEIEKHIGECLNVLRR